MSSDDFPEWLVEMCARAIYEERWAQNVPLNRDRGAHRQKGQWDKLSLVSQRRWRQVARAVLTAIRESGCKIVSPRITDSDDWATIPFAPPNLEGYRYD